MTTQTMFDVTATKTLSERLIDTPFDPARGRAREYAVIFALTFLVLMVGIGLARLAAPRRCNSAGARSIVLEAKSAARSALAYAYRH